MYRRLKLSLSTALLVALAACGGGGTSPTPPGPPPPPPPPPPAPVATVAVTPNTANLFPTDTKPLVAATFDAAGNPLSGRAVAWTTSAGTVATVSSSGLVTAVGAGSATITATSETKTGTAAITVADGGQVTTAGGNITAVGGAVTMVIPPGAVSAPVSITVTPTTVVPTDPTGAWGVHGTQYIFSPEGTTFSTPVTVTMKYDPARVPGWVIPSDFALYHYTGGAWVKFTNITVDPVAHTISGQTTGFSPVQATITIPTVVLQPDPAFVSILQRSVVVTATLFNHPTILGLTYDFSGSTKQNGAVTQILPSDNTAQYTMTQPTLPSGDLDVVFVKVMGHPDPLDPFVAQLGFATVRVNSNLKFTFEVNPEFGKTGFGQTANLQAVLRNADGTVFVNTTDNFVEYAWKRTSNFGDLDISSPARTTSFNAVYTAKQPGQVQRLNPRADQIDVEFWVTEPKIIDPDTKPPTTIPSTTLKGTATAFIDVAPKTSFGTFTVRTTPSPGGSCVAAVALIPKVTGAASYDVQVTGILDPSAPSFHKTLPSQPVFGPLSILDMYDAGGGNWGVPIVAGCATSTTAVHAREALYATMFALTMILSTVP